MFLTCHQCKQGFDIKYFNPLRIQATCPHCGMFNHLGEAVEREYGKHAGARVKEIMKALMNVGARGKESLAQLADFSWWKIEQIVQRITLAALILLLLTTPLEAKPWYKDPKAWIVIAVSVGSSLAATHYAGECREHNGVAPCAGGYGPFQAREYGIRLGLTATLLGVGLGLRHDRAKEWALFPLGYAAYNAGEAFHQSRINVPKERE